MKTLFSNISKATPVLFLVCFCFIQSVASQNPDTRSGCEGCECSRTFCRCKVLNCCEPNISECSCRLFMCKCGCGSVSAPVVNKANISEFASFLRSKEFSSLVASDLASKFDQILAASDGNNFGLYESVGIEAETIAINLPPVEKQKANNWILSRGGTTLIP
ncbi:MAG: hypothetical protein KA138_09290 [Saprospiraceae bacterium]|nr:hypothetical protein [Lewinellaceae bacterium]MBP6811704.1 hypothetical protein [Saprospiraceae bacterium]